MKIHTLSMLVITVVLFCGCSSAKFTEYHGSEVFQGSGGEVRTVDGIDFWENGYPDRKYKILGVIEQGHHRHLPGHLSGLFSTDRDEAIAKDAHKHDGDAVIFVARNNGQSDDDEDQSGSARHRRFTLVVIKYAE